jgi:hypothetical protein
MFHNDPPLNITKHGEQWYGGAGSLNSLAFVRTIRVPDVLRFHLEWWKANVPQIHYLTYLVNEAR